MKLSKLDQNAIVRLYEAIGGLKAEAGFENEYGKFKFIVDDLIKLSQKYETEYISLKTIQDTDAFKNIPGSSQHGSVDRIMKADYSFPIILQVDRDRNITGIGDGTHRIRAAIRDGKETIPAKLIPIEGWRVFKSK